MRLELTREGLIIMIANQYIIRGGHEYMILII